MVKICEVVDRCEDCPRYADDCDGRGDAEMLNEDFRPKYMQQSRHNDGKDLISRADAIEAVKSCLIRDVVIRKINALPSAETVQGWRTGKPKKQGEYTVTVKSMRGGMVELLYYGKPLMPNRKVKGMCWYRVDDEWGDVVYDDADILAWMPLPKPYREDGEV